MVLTVKVLYSICVQYCSFKFLLHEMCSQTCLWQFFFFALESFQATTESKRKWCHSIQMSLNSPHFSPNDSRMWWLCRAFVWAKSSCCIKPFYFNKSAGIYLPRKGQSCLLHKKTGPSNFSHNTSKILSFLHQCVRSHTLKSYQYENDTQILPGTASRAQWLSKISSSVCMERAGVSVLAVQSTWLMMERVRKVTALATFLRSC